MRTALVLLALCAPAAAAPAPRPTVPLAPPHVLHPELRPAGAVPLNRLLDRDPDWARRNPQAMCATSRALADAGQVQAERARRRLERAGGRPEAAPVGYVEDGIVVLENDGRMMKDDRWPDLAGRAARFTPRPGGGFDAADVAPVYVPPSAQQFVDERNGFRSFPVALPFSFPFGAGSFAQVWMTNTMGLFFLAPVAPATPQLREAQVLYDRAPRIAPFLGGTSYYGHTGYADVSATQAVFTWVTNEVDVQVVLRPSGEIEMNWQRLGGLHGAVAVIDGNDAFWASETGIGSWTDGADVSPLGVAEDPACEVLDVRTRQIPGTPLTRFVLELQGPPPASGGKWIYYELEFFSGPGAPDRLDYEYVIVQDGRVIDGSVYAQVVGSTLEIGMPFTRVDPAQVSFELRLHTWLNDGGWIFRDDVVGGIQNGPPTGPPVMTDVSAELPWSGLRPFYEAFTLPELDTYAVYDAYVTLVGAAPVESLPIYQNVYTEIIFWAGAYSTVGNAGADGIGVGSSTEPLFPALLHMNALGYGWNSWEGGRTTVLNQEFGHHWAYFARIRENNATSNILNPDGAHPAPWVHTPAVNNVFLDPDFSSFGGTFWTQFPPGRFNTPGGAGAGLWDFEMYTMGLIDPSEDRGLSYYIRDPQPGFGGQIGYWPPPTLPPPDGTGPQSGSAVPVSIQQIVDEHGPRNPAYPDAPRDFRVPFVLVVRPGTLDPTHSRTLASYCTEWERNFPIAATVQTPNGPEVRGTVSCFSRCIAPSEPVGNTLFLVKGALPGLVRYLWTDLARPGVDDYAVLEDADRQVLAPVELGAAAEGSVGVELQPGAGTRFYRVAARDQPDCMGPR